MLVPFYNFKKEKKKTLTNQRPWFDGWKKDAMLLKRPLSCACACLVGPPWKWHYISQHNYKMEGFITSKGIISDTTPINEPEGMKPTAPHGQYHRHCWHNVVQSSDWSPQADSSSLIFWWKSEIVKTTCQHLMCEGCDIRCMLWFLKRTDLKSVGWNINVMQVTWLQVTRPRSGSTKKPDSLLMPSSGAKVRPHTSWCQLFQNMK